VNRVREIIEEHNWLHGCNGDGCDGFGKPPIGRGLIAAQRRRAVLRNRHERNCRIRQQGAQAVGVHGDVEHRDAGRVN